MLDLIPFQELPTFSTRGLGVLRCPRSLQKPGHIAGRSLPGLHLRAPWPGMPRRSPSGSKDPYFCLIMIDTKRGSMDSGPESMEQFCASNGSWPRKARLVNEQPSAINPGDEGGIRPGPSDPPAVEAEEGVNPSVPSNRVGRGDSRVPVAAVSHPVAAVVDEEAVEAQGGSTAPRPLKSPLLQIGR